LKYSLIFIFFICTMTSMSTIHFEAAQAATDSGPACASCSGPTRLIGIEPHPTRAQTDLRTYQCMACEHVQANVVPIRLA
jgi:hypothetical protein